MIWEISAVVAPVAFGVWLVVSFGAKRVRREWPEAKKALRELFRE